jgi:predicted O-methyltransferase YrrM
MWHAKVKHRLLQQGLENVDYRQASSPYAAALSDLAPASFDLAIVDGVDRTDEMRNAIQLVRPGGFIYLDNSDFPDYREAEALLLASTDKAPRYFRDILPYSIVANEGVIIQTRPM